MVNNGYMAIGNAPDAAKIYHYAVYERDLVDHLEIPY
jgi:hypothetical protein